MTTASENARRPRIDSEADPSYRVQVQNLDARVLLRITAMAFRYRWRMGLGIVATIGAAIFQLFVPQFLGRAVDQAHGLLATASDAAGRATALFSRDLGLTRYEPVAEPPGGGG